MVPVSITPFLELSRDSYRRSLYYLRSWYWRRRTLVPGPQSKKVSVLDKESQRRNTGTVRAGRGSCGKLGIHGRYGRSQSL